MTSFVRSPAHRSGPSLGDAGVALPLALVGVVFMSILVTGMLVTSSLESAMSRAHQDGLRSIYESEGAIEAFVEENLPDVWEGALAGPYPAAQGINSTTRVISIARLRDQEGPIGEREISTSIVAEPANGRGRSVGVLLTHLVPPPLETNLDAGLVFASDARVAGTALISDGSDSTEKCDLDNVGGVAIRYGSDVHVRVEGAARRQMVGDTVQDTRTGEQLVAESLGGKINDIRSLAQFAQIKFGKMYQTDTYRRPRDPNVSSVDHPRSSRFNWGCPELMPDDQNCVANGGDTKYFPSVAIDAEGGTVTIQGHHGQGTLMVVNGHLEIDGSFNFRGIVMVEGNLRIAGSKQNFSSIEGAVIAGGDTEVVVDDESEIDGGALIRFNRCAIRDAEKGFHSSGASLFNRIGWFEVVR